MITADPLLGPSGNYGGPTQTMPLLPGSPAIDAGTATGAPSTDARLGRVAPVNIGAYESGNASAVNTAVDTPGTDPGTLSLRQATHLADVLRREHDRLRRGRLLVTTDDRPRRRPLESSGISGVQAIIGPASGLSISGDGLNRVLMVNAGVIASFSGLTITDGYDAVTGAGLYNLGTTSLTNVIVSGNSAAYGGGIRNGPGRSLTISYSTIDDNEATSDSGGGIDRAGKVSIDHSSLIENQAYGLGGAIRSVAGSVLAIADSLIRAR